MKVVSEERKVVVINTAPKYATGQGTMTHLAARCLGADEISFAEFLEKNPIQTKILGYLEFFKYARWRIMNNEASIVYHGHARSVMGMLRDFLLLSLLPPQVRVIFHCHGFDLSEKKASLLKRYLAIRFLRKLDLWIFLNRASLPKYLSNRPGYQEKIKILDNCISSKELSELGAMTNRKDPKQIAVIFIGAFTEDKGAEVFVKLAQKCAAVNLSRKIDFLMVGQSVGSSPNSLWNARNCENLTIVDGRVRENCINSLNESDILVFPSRYTSECQPLVIVEGLIAGAKILAFDHNSLSEQFSEFNITWTNEQGLYKDLLAVFDEMDLRTSWAANRMEDAGMAKERFSEAKFKKTLQCIVNEIGVD